MAQGAEERNGELAQLKLNLREGQAPFFDDLELQYQLERAGHDVDTATYNCLLIKAEECALSVSGLSIADSSAYWLRRRAVHHETFWEVSDAVYNRRGSVLSDRNSCQGLFALDNVSGGRHMLCPNRRYQ